jgi:uncharacterized SAM-binding protein YcdF (DUF218 family)
MAYSRPTEIISQILRSLATPLGGSLFLCSLGLLLYRQSPLGGMSCEVAGAVLLLLFSSPLVGQALLRSLEDHYPSLDPEFYPQADAIVVLGSVTGLPMSARLSIDVNGEFNRLLQGMRLLRIERAPLLVLSGGIKNSWGKSDVTEAARMKSLALEYGVESGAILLEERARNTYENALFTWDLLQEQGVQQVLLVTSAAHMLRAAAVFRSQGLEVIPVSTGVRTMVRPFSLMQFLPAIRALEYSTIAMREYIGLLFYYLRGWCVLRRNGPPISG